jgi:glyoxylate carboligase
MARMPAAAAAVAILEREGAIDNITEFEELADHREHAPTSVALLD